MPLESLKIFFCYTTRNEEITRSILEKIKIQFSLLNVYTFIDLLDNSTCPWQAQVEQELLSCDIIFALHTPHFLNSPWVKEELLLAKSHNKPIIFLSQDIIEKILLCTSSKDLKLLIFSYFQIKL